MYGSRIHLVAVAVVVAFFVVLTGCGSDEQDAQNDNQNEHSNQNQEVETPDFVYQASVENGQRIHGATLDGEYTELTDAEGFDVEDMVPVFSWDGDTFAYSHGSASAADIYLYDLDDDTATRLTEFGEDENRTCLSRNFDSASQAVAIRCSTGEDNIPYFAATVTTDGEVTVFEPDESLFESEDDELRILDGGFHENDDFVGLTISYDSSTDEAAQEIRRLDPNDPQDHGEVLAEFDETGIPFPSTSSLAGRWTEDVDRMVVSLLLDPETPETAMYLADLKTGETEELLNDESGVKYPLSMDGTGQRLLFATGTSQTDIGRLAIMDLEDGTETVLADDTDLERGTVQGKFSPDGQQVIFTDTKGDLGDSTWEESTMYRVDTDGSDLERIDWVHDVDQVIHPMFNPGAF